MRRTSNKLLWKKVKRDFVETRLVGNTSVFNWVQLTSVIRRNSFRRMAGHYLGIEKKGLLIKSCFCSGVFVDISVVESVGLFTNSHAPN